MDTGGDEGGQSVMPPILPPQGHRPLCHICLDPIEEGSRDAGALLGCEDSEQFHASCIQAWLEVNATCPTCRREPTSYPFLSRMGSAPYDTTTQTLGLAAIGKTASTERPFGASSSSASPHDHVNQLGLLGACRLVAAAMRNHPTERTVQFLGCEAIEALTARSEANRAHLVEEEAIHSLLYQALDRFSRDRELQTVACHAIVAVASGHQEWQSRFGEAGACTKLVQMLCAWPLDYGTQIACIFAINGLLHRHPANGRRLVEAGVGSPLLLALRKYWRKMELVDAAITAVYSLVAHADADQHQQQQQMVLPDGAWGTESCKVMVGLLAAHTGAAEAKELMIKACFTLAKLAFRNPSNRERLANLNAIRVVARVMEQHASDLGVQVAACAAIVSLYMPLNYVEEQEQDEEEGRQPTATDKKMESAGLKAPGGPSCGGSGGSGWQINNLNNTKGGQQQQQQQQQQQGSAMMASAGAGDRSSGPFERLAFLSMVRALAAFPAEPDLEISASPGLLFLLDAMASRDSHPQLVVLDDEPSAHLFLSAMRNYLHDEDSQDIYLEVILLTTDEHPRTRETLMKGGLLNHILELMGRYPSNASLQEKCCMCLTVLSEDSVGARDDDDDDDDRHCSSSRTGNVYPYHCRVDYLWSEAKVHEILARLVSVMAIHPTKAVLQHFAVSCLQNLAEEGGQDIRVAVMDAPILAMVCRCLAHHPRSEDIQTASLGLRAALVEGGKEEEEEEDAMMVTGGNERDDEASRGDDKGGAASSSWPVVLSSEEYIEAVVKLISKAVEEDVDDPILRAGALRWLALLAEDCTDEEARALCSSHSQPQQPNAVKALVEDSYLRFAAASPPTYPSSSTADGLMVRTACIALLSHLPYAGLSWPDWEPACRAVVESLDYSLGEFMVVQQQQQQQQQPEQEVEEEDSMATIRAAANLIRWEGGEEESSPNATRLAQVAGKVEMLLQRLEASKEEQDVSWGRQ